ncbi:MAG: hypothetical protein IH595_01790 [Bacteroidales bacterium]|nr:hypothetical protein [Bacteroidales bacterium]
MMKRNKVYRNIILLSILLMSGSLVAQTVPVNMPVLSDYYRVEQLMGKVNPDISFTAMPFFPKEALKIQNSFDPDSTLKQDSFFKFSGRMPLGKKGGYIQLMPVTWQQQFNTHHPEGINDGTMIPARGYQTLFSAGIYAQYGPLSIQLMPEIDYANNTPFAGFPVSYSDEVWAQYYWHLNTIDIPERFGNGSYSKINWGQSSIRLTFGAVSLGLSNENLWWGPGLRNDLIMTDNAPGFKHLTFNTVRPVKTVIGSFEWQLIAGRLENSGFLPPQSTRTFNGGVLYSPKPDEWRYLSGLLLTYNPKWVPGLFMGFARTVQSYHKNVGVNLVDYFPVFSPLGLDAAGGDAKIAKQQQQLYSVFARWLWKKAHGEVYFEYGWSNYYWDVRDLEVQLPHSGAFVLGFRKLIPLKLHKDEYISAMMEFTQLAMNSTTIARGGSSWYLSGVVPAGYTNEGQYLGAGIGQGSNLQTLEVQWVKSLKSIGLRVERYVHDNDFFYLYIKDIRRNWVDISASLLGTWPYKNLLFNAQLEWVKSMNYEWQFTPPPAPAYWGPGLDVKNYHLSLGVTYRF